MPQVDVTYAGLILQAVGQRSERRHLPEGATLGDLLRDLEQAHGEPVRKLLFGERRELLSYALVAVNGTAKRDLAALLGEDGALVRIGDESDDDRRLSAPRGSARAQPNTTG